MTTIAMSPERVFERVRFMRRKRPDERFYGIYHPWAWSGARSVLVDGAEIPVAYCPTPLAIGEALAESAPDLPLVLLCGVVENELPQDVLGRLADRRLDRLDPWTMVRESFQAFQIDPRVAKQQWMAAALLDAAPTSGYLPVATGVLDLDTAWTHLLRQYLGLPDGRPDAESILTFSLSPEAEARLARVSGEMRTALSQRAGQTGGAVAAMMLEACLAGHVQWLMPIGMVCEILFTERQVDPETSGALARLERFTGGHALSPEIGEAWSRASTAVLTRLDDEGSSVWLARTEQLVAEIRIGQRLARSRLLPGSFEARISALADTIDGAVAGTADLAAVDRALGEVRNHREASRQQDRVDRMRMAARLVRYLRAALAAYTAPSLATAACQYLTDGRFVDWARSALLAGDANASLSEALSRLSAGIQIRREAQNKGFAEHLAAWHRTPVADAALMGIENVLSSLVAPIARERPVLLLVLDGMSHAVMRELAESLERDRWIELEPESRQSPAILSAIPSVTELSRTSLLAGTLTKGGAPDEKRLFESRPELVAASPGTPPALFHKGDVWSGGDSGLAAEIRSAIDDRQRRVVGIVLNAIDDSLSGSDQLRLSWTLEAMRHLDALLHHARISGRAVIVTSDHGHVLESVGGTRALPSESDQERWRAAGGSLAPEEITIEGNRILALLGRPSVVVPWSEAVRYGRRKNGYHGGAALQEVMVPLAVFVAAEVLAEGDPLSLAGWQPALDQKPKWWFPEESGAVPVPEPAPVPSTPAPAWKRAPLFEQLESSAGEAEKGWIERLLGSEVFAAQRKIAGKAAPDDGRVRQILNALSRRNGRVAKRLLASDIQEPEFRLRSLMASLQRVLNVDGYAVLTMDDAAGAVCLDEALLRKQFQVSESQE